MRMRGTLTLRKQCWCSPSTASGPRLTGPRVIYQDGDPVRLVVLLVRMACDVCDTPWKESSS